MKKKWYILVTRSRFEKKCDRVLSLNGFETYLPLSKELKLWSDRKKWVEKPLFSGYIFVKFSSQERFNVLHSDGIARIVQFEQVDYCIDEKLIEGIKDYLSSNSKPILVEMLDLEIGEEVLIKNGPFKGLKGTLTQIKGKTRVLVAIMAIGHAFAIELKGNDIERLRKTA
jgi:transcription antitermination factor NusG